MMGGGGGGSSNYDVHISGGTIHVPWPGTNKDDNGKKDDHNHLPGKEDDEKKDDHHHPPDKEDDEKVPGEDFPNPELPTNPKWPPIIPVY